MRDNYKQLYETAEETLEDLVVALEDIDEDSVRLRDNLSRILEKYCGRGLDPQSSIYKILTQNLKVK